MAKLVFDAAGSRYYETGVSKGVLYVWDESAVTPAYKAGVAWNGLTSVSENPTGGDIQSLYADNIKYLNLQGTEELEASIECYTYPDAWMDCDGSKAIATGEGKGGVFIGQQKRSHFAMCYQTKVGNDQDSEKGYKIHILYGCLATPSERSYATVNDSPEAITFSFDVKTTPTEEVPNGMKPTALVVIDSTKTAAAKLSKIEEALYGIDVEAFSETKTYALNALCVHETKVYKCTTAIETPGTWDASKWTEYAESADPKVLTPNQILTILNAA